MTSHTHPDSVSVSGSSLSATPRKSKTNSHSQFAASAEVGRQDNPAQMDRWKHRMIHGYSRVVPVADFFAVYMHGDAKPPTLGQIDKIVNSSQTQLKKTANEIKNNKIELNMYPTFIEYVQTMAANLPASTRPTFDNTSGITFKRLHPTDHDSRPDVCAPLAGLKLPEIWEWHHVGTVIEFKLYDDPFDASGNIKSGQLANLVQLLKNARCILMASGACYVFVVSVFRNNARLFRVDRSGYIVSNAFDWSVNARVFPEFYWRLYNGAKGGRLLGHDSTVSTPTLPQKKKMFARLKKLPQYASMSFEDATARSRWVKVKFGDKDTQAFTVGPPIFQSKGLFGRGTRVERVLIEGQNPPQMYAMKDAWRQACRRPESHFYEVIQDYANEKCAGKTNGLATCVGSLDLSTLHPEHKTITAGLRADGNELLDRCHDRSLFTPVGFTLDQFHSTKQLVQALRSAIAGHELALLAGVLHRDVSAGNVLIDEGAPALADAGFILDFDYSEFTEAGLERFAKLHPDFHMEEVDKDLKDITGTYPFMALPALVHMMQPGVAHTYSSQHDLESFYWLLVWLLLRHTDHCHIDGPDACSGVFDGEARQVFRAKSSWLANLGIGGPRLPIVNNAPLTSLVDKLNEMFRIQNTPSGAHATHETLLAAFDAALESAGWPENDTAKIFVAPLTNRDMPPPVVPGSTGSQASWDSSGSYWRAATKAAVVVPPASTASQAVVQGRRQPTAGGSGSGSGIKRKAVAEVEEKPPKGNKRLNRK